MIPFFLGARSYSARTVGVVVDATGQAREGAVSTFDAVLSMQPMRWEEKVKLLPEGQRTSRAWRAYGAPDERLRPARPEDGLRAAQVLVNERWCDVHALDDYSSGQLSSPTLHHMRLLLVEVGR